MQTSNPSILSHFAIGWRSFKAHPGIFVVSTFLLFLSWVILEVAVITLQRLGLVVWLFLHLGFFFLFSGLMVGFYRLALKTIEGGPVELADLTRTVGRGSTLLLAFCIYLLKVLGGLVLLILPGIYVAARYALFGCVVAAEPVTAMTALRNAATLSEGRWWSVCLFMLVMLLLNLAGAAFLGFGLLLTFPVSILATSDLYRSLRQSRSSSISRPTVVTP